MKQISIITVMIGLFLSGMAFADNLNNANNQSIVSTSESNSNCNCDSEKCIKSCKNKGSNEYCDKNKCRDKLAGGKDAPLCPQKNKDGDAKKTVAKQ